MLEMRSKSEGSQAAIALGIGVIHLLLVGNLAILPIVSKFSRRGAEVG